MLVLGAVALLVLWLQRRILPGLGYAERLPFARVVALGMVAVSWTAALVSFAVAVLSTR